MGANQGFLKVLSTGNPVKEFTFLCQLCTRAVTVIRIFLCAFLQNCNQEIVKSGHSDNQEEIAAGFCLYNPVLFVVY